MKLYLISMLMLLGSCSLQKMAIRSASPVFVGAADGMMRESNWDFFRTSAPGNIKFLEVLWEQDKDNLELLAALTKTYAGYSFAVHETMYLRDELLGLDESNWKKEAITYYTRALDFGLLYLKKRGLSERELIHLNGSALTKKLKDLGPNDMPALLYTAQAWGSLINLQKDNIVLITYVPKVKQMFDRVCELRPQIDNNVCEIFYAQYESSRPKMLGGNPERGEKLFLDSIKNHPKNLLIRMNYLQYVIVPKMDKALYEKESVILKQEFLKWEDLGREDLVNRSSYATEKNLNLFNAIARKRFEIIESLKNKIF